MKDKITKTYTINIPIYETLTESRKVIKSQPAAAMTNPGKITQYGNFIFISETNTGIHVIDNSNPAAPKNVSFINIPGNEDLAIKGNTLYADSYGDLVTFDISDPLNARTVNFVSNAFPDHSNYYYAYAMGTAANPDSVYVITGYTTKDTTVDYDPDNNGIIIGPCINCQYFAPAAGGNLASMNSGNTVGTNGSMARFSIINNFLYAVGSYSLTSFDISDLSSPVYTSTQSVDFHVETIYPLKDKLFVGTNDGMYMYNVTSSPSNPAFVGKLTHIRGCDPVIADEHYAYITLNDSSACLGFDNQLQVIDINDMANTFMVKAYQLTHPVGLSKDGNTLFLCDSRDGLKVYNATDVSNLLLIKQLKDGIVYDVIAQNGLAIVMAIDGLYEYDYSDLNNIHLISKL